MRRKKEYIRHHESEEELVITDTINGGVIARAFCPEEGHAIHNSYLAHFISEDNLKKEWNSFHFASTIKADKAIQDEVEGLCLKVLDELMSNYVLWPHVEEYASDLFMIYKESGIIKDILFGQKVLDAITRGLAKGKEESASLENYIRDELDSHIKRTYPENVAEDILFMGDPTEPLCDVFHFRKVIENFSLNLQKIAGTPGGTDE